MTVLATTQFDDFRVHAVPAFSDNYLWLLETTAGAVVFDPGDAGPVTRALAELACPLLSILVTHHHPDHIGGIATLKQQWNCPVFGPDDPRIPTITDVVAEGASIDLPGLPAFDVWHVPGHTRTHLAYLTAGAIFVGDTLFGAGCGRVFEGPMSDLYRSLHRIAGLPGDTLVFCSHEYTAANLRFAATVEAGNGAYQRRLAAMSDGRPSVPFRLAAEFDSNVFLRCDRDTVRQAVAEHAGIPRNADEDLIFAALRQWKNEHV
jgi:hydroxyacylglutathione hydrolase